MSSGILHNYYGKLSAFEHTFPNSTSHDKVILFLGGLGDGLGTVPYVRSLAEALNKIGWGVIEIQTNSTLEGWAQGSLARDAFDLSNAVDFFRNTQKKTKIVLFGHSTGTQNSMYYATQVYKGTQNVDYKVLTETVKNRPAVDAIVLQASVSDREAFIKGNGLENWKSSLKVGKELLKADLLKAGFDTPQVKALDTSSLSWYDDGFTSFDQFDNDKERPVRYSLIPPKYTDLFFGSHANSYRWVSLLDIRGGDDFFSSDLDDVKDFKEKTFGQLTVPVLVLYSGNDEFVPDHVDKEELVKRFQKATNPKLWSPYSGVVPNATHSLEGAPKESYNDLIARSVKFLESL